MLVLESVVLAEQEVDGLYSLKIKGRGNGGNTNVSQGGGFEAEAHADTVLGTMMLGAGKSYDVALEVKIGGTVEMCSARV